MLYRMNLLYPTVRLDVIGRSVMEKNIYAMTIGNGEGPSIMINAAHHGNEWITTPLVLKFAEELAQNPTQYQIHIIPMVNPDGVDIVTKHHQRDWKANVKGVDLNSNYPAGYDKARKYKFAKGYTRPGPRDYVGEYPLCQPESKAMVDYTCKNDFVHTISLHTQGEEIYWQYNDYQIPGAEALANKLAAASGYALVEVPEESSHGGYRDWFIEAYRRPGVTVECGLGVNPLDVGDFEKIYKKIGPLLWAGCS